MEGQFLINAVIYLAAAVVCVPIAKKAGMGSVLGYLLAGIMIGPFVLGFIGEEGEDIMHFAEFGVVMMLFLVGLELEPAKFWRMRRLILGIGSMQLLFTVLLLIPLLMFLTYPWALSVAVALALAMSSTAIGLQNLKEKNLLGSAAGQSSFAVLLFQDIAVIPILALLPLLASGAPAAEGHHTLIADYPGWLQTLMVLGAVGVIIVAGRYVVVPLLRVVAKTHLHELFSASALLLVFAIALLMQMVGLSPALGTFLAGVVLANSEFKHELESDLEPFKGLLLGLFFLAVGASINFALIFSRPLFFLSVTLTIMALKGVVLSLSGYYYKLRGDQNRLFALGLSQVGEFAFVLLAFSSQLSIADKTTVETFMAVTALSMTLTPILLLINEKFIQPYFGTREQLPAKTADDIDEQHAVIIAGFSHFGSTLGRFLRANGVQATILDNDSDRVDLLRKMGFKVFYGDATREELLRSAGAEEAKLLVIAIDDTDTTFTAAEMAKKHFPQLTILVRAKNRMDAYDLLDLGLKDIYRETLDTSVRMGGDVLRKLGRRAYTVQRAAQNFIKYDEASMLRLAEYRHDMQNYISNVREHIAEQEELLQNDLQFNPTSTDHTWDSEYIRETINRE